MIEEMRLKDACFDLDNKKNRQVRATRLFHATATVQK
jgi:hypothetical protein